MSIRKFSLADVDDDSQANNSHLVKLSMHQQQHPRTAEQLDGEKTRVARFVLQLEPALAGKGAIENRSAAG